MSVQQTNTEAGEIRQLDAVVIGAGFAGLRALYKLRDEMGMDVQVYETGDGVRRVREAGGGRVATGRGLVGIEAEIRLGRAEGQLAGGGGEYGT